MKTLLQLAFVGLLSSTATAQWVNTPPPQVPRTADGKADLSAPAPRLADGTPDLSGIWQPPTGYLRDLARDLKEPVPFQPWAKALYDERAAGRFWREEPDANCLPQGVPKVVFAPAPCRIVQSTASWQGDTLVVESGGFNGRVWLDQLGKPSTEALRVTTRFRRKDFGHMDIGVTIDDAKAYTKPWGTTVPVTLLPNTQLMEFICLENEKKTGGK